MNESVHFSSLCTELPGLASCWQPGAGNTLEQVCLSRGASHPTVACPASLLVPALLRRAGPSLNGWPRRGETGALFSGRWSRVSHHSPGCPADHSPLGVSAGTPVPVALPIWTVVTEKTAWQPPWQHGFHLGCTQQGWGTTFITASVLSHDAPLATNQIFPWSRWPQDYMQCHSESHIVGSFNFAGR